MSEEYKYNISLVLDARRKKTTGQFPVKLRVYSKTISKAKLYNTERDLTKVEFQNIWTERGTTKLRGKNREARTWLEKYKARADDEAKRIDPFDFETFEKRFFRKSGDSNNVYHHYKILINENIRKGKIGTSESFKYSLKSIQSFIEAETGKEPLSLSYHSVNVNWLNKYEAFMLIEGKSVTSIGIYLRALRVVFNRAISDNDIVKELYPFGGKKYQIPDSKKVKKALNSDELGILFNSVPKTPQQEKAKDFWFFSYSCSGINTKDILLLKYSDLKEDKISYYRAKTFSKSKVKNKIEIYINDYSKAIIKKYGSNNLDGFIFPILKVNDSNETQYAKTKNFTRFVNQHVKIMAKDNDLPEEISLYWARHSFATNSIRKGASMEFISEALNHSDLKVTKNYFAGFEDKAKKEFTDKLMDF